MNNLATGANIGVALLKALGMDGQRVTELTVNVSSTSVVEVTVNRYVDKDEFNNFVQEVSLYKLVPPEVMTAIQEAFQLLETMKDVDFRGGKLSDEFFPEYDATLERLRMLAT